MDVNDPGVVTEDGDDVVVEGSSTLRDVDKTLLAISSEGLMVTVVDCKSFSVAWSPSLLSGK